jgi:hypothetical protein
MTAIEQIKARLRKYPHVRYEVRASSISVLPASDDGFTVGLEVGESQYTVFFNGWHEHFQEQEEALDCFAFGLSDECRLEECRRGNFAYRWTVESKQNDKWVADSVTGLFLFPFWRSKNVRYLQNNLITSKKETGGMSSMFEQNAPGSIKQC